MVRRVDTSDEETTPQRPSKVKTEKAKPERGKAKAQEDGSPKGTKRARVNDAGDAVARGQDEDEDDDADDDDDDDEDEGEQPTTQAPKRVKTLPRDTDGYIPGSIVRIQLRNFVTYDAVEFRPGPYLNMILGPNGTGKSSIACAICLGLNWSPAILGRATNLPSFVKINTDSGHIEIELKGPAGQPNLVIRRNLSAKSKSSSFTLNGHSATGSEITARVAALNVQVGNLCSFLPQDKVSSFAAMSPVELLRETENAAGDVRLKQWHATLIEDGKSLKGVRETIQKEEDTMRGLQERNEQIERDVQRYKERKKIEHAIALLKVLIPVQHYREARDAYMVLKGRQRDQHNKVMRLKAKNEPAHNFLKKLETEHKSLLDERDELKRKVRVALGKTEDRTKQAAKLEGESENIQTDLSNVRRNEKRRVEAMRKLREDIEKTEKDVKKEVKIEDDAELRAEKGRMQAEFQGTSFNDDRRAWDLKKQALEERKRVNGRSEDEGRRQLRDLDSVSAQKLASLSRWDRNVADTVGWLRANREKFRMEVFEPPVLCLTVPDKTFAAAVESNFNPAAMKMFVCQCKEDYDTLNHHINDNPGLGRTVRVPTWFRPGAEHGDRDLAPPPLSQEELKELGFDGYALQYVDCPEGLKWYLKRELGMHRVAISRRGVLAIDRAIEMVSRIDANGRVVGASFVDRNTVHQVSRSKYGARAAMTTAIGLRPARNFGENGIQVNPADKQRVDEILQRCKQEAVMIADEEREMGVEKNRLDGLQKEHKAQIKEIDERLEKIKKQMEAKMKLERKLQADQQKLAALENQRGVQEQEARLRKKLMEVNKRRVGYVSQAVDHARDVMTEQQRATVAGLQYLHVGAKKNAFKELVERKDHKFNLALNEFHKIDDEYQKLKEDTKSLLAESKAVLSDMVPEIVDEYHAIEQGKLAHERAVKEAEENGEVRPEPAEGVDTRTMEELQTELETQEANLEMNMNTNPGVVEQYEKRKREIEALQRSVEMKTRDANKIEKNIKTARDNWEPALRALVDSIGKKFSAAFDRIGCAGEIRVRPEEAYDQWAIDILVKFRDTEKLQLLTGQRQSGGERSLTTILYLMSLTEEARAPFSLVDEINQGMDQRAERMVHNSMVEVTCKPDSAQYFLITPKLLPDLEYHERMKILCVNNGEWLPEEGGLGNMMSMINGFVAKNPNGMR